ncbi:hypothetical protein GGX14DRAFT_409455 [Mycena pura]|uniref:Ricin B lectin domain-containing protein n=1 Tax=Mycena pura TaxID=153505 RepID=A0AAD6YU31_9AGAR|nr:hypothetical protein GGX14DRAFT_409455 [Mycena pura]
MKAISLAVVAAGLFAAVGASALARRASPDPDAAAAHVLIQPFQNRTLCITATGVSTTSPTILSPCNQTSGVNSSQIWGVNPLGGSVVQFQNVGNNQCFACQRQCANRDAVRCFADDHPKQTAFGGDRSQQSAGRRCGHGLLLGSSGNSVVVNACSGGFSQTWIMTAV